MWNQGRWYVLPIMLKGISNLFLLYKIGQIRAGIYCFFVKSGLVVVVSKGQKIGIL